MIMEKNFMTNKYAIYNDKGKRVSNWVSSIVADVLKRKLEKVNYGKKYQIKKAFLHESNYNILLAEKANAMQQRIEQYFSHYAKSIHTFMDLDKAVGYYSLEKMITKILEKENNCNEVVDAIKELQNMIMKKNFI